MRKQRTPFLLLAAAMIAPLCPASASPAWPGTPRPAMKVATHDELCDGVPVKITELVGGGLRIRLDSVGGWVHSGQSSTRASILLAHHSNPDVRLGFSVFSPDELLPDLGSSHWKSYLEAIRSIHGESLLELTTGGTVEGGDAMFVFGQPYREVVITLQEAPDAPMRVRREVFCFVGGRLLAITLEGESDPVLTLSRAFQLFVARLELAG